MRAGESICMFLVTFLVLLCSISADTVIKQVSDPTGNVNLTPFQQWISAYQCLQNVSNSCSDKYELTENGWVNLNQTDTDEYCKPGGCADHTRAVLWCIYQVKRDYKFIDKSTVIQINNTITLGCNQGFTGAAVPLSASGAGRIYESISALFLLIVPAIFVIFYF